MTKAQYYLDGMPLSLAKKIGRGGEGEVYLDSNNSRTAVKIYTGSPNQQREAKVLSMVKHKLASRTNLVSFPKGIVETKSGLFAGFSMNLVSGHRPLHEVYGPKSRKIHFPNADYRFLIRVATNIARAVGQVHQTTCVIGDINHSGILVSKDATVAIIDADSFQFEMDGTNFPCLVGVPEFTPPELQGKSLTGVIRTREHDKFGLAIAIFQLLFMGRHPYAGRHPDPNLSLEQAIARNLFAYSRLRKTQITPPASMVTFDDFPSYVADAFEYAFGVDYLSRPEPSHWVSILKEFESNLSRCDVNPMHYFPSTGKNCLWCKMESSSGAILFLDSFKISSAHVIHSELNFDKIWADITSISIDQINSLIPKFANPLIASPSREALFRKSPLKNKKVLSVLGAIASIVAWNLAPALIIIWVVIIIVCVAYFFENDYTSNASVWTAKYQKIDKTFNEALNAWRQRSGVARLHEIRSGLDNIGNEFKNISTLKSRTLSEFNRDRRNNQLINYLDKYLLSRASIPGIGQGKKVVLASFGIETAADILKSDILKIPGFGEATADKLLAWRATCEKKFVFKSKNLPDEARHQVKIENEFNAKSDALLKRLSSGCAELQQAFQQVQARFNNGDQYLQQLFTARAQLEFDLKYLGLSKPSSGYSQTSTSSTSKVTTNQKLQPNTTNAPRCYKCGSMMIRRVARRGRNSGNSFWGCSSYPRCRAIRP